MLKSLVRSTLAALGLTALLIGPAPAAAAPAARPALWAVSDHDTTVYLFGTIHLLPDKYQWRTPAFDQAVKGSQQLVVETIIDLRNARGIMNDKMRLGFSRGLPPIAERVPAERRALLRSAIAKSGVPESVYDQMETWLAALELLGVRFREIGLSGGAGPEETLRQEFGAASKPVGELETIAEQLSYFDTLSEKSQRALLEGAISAPEEMSRDFGEMLAAWARGDLSALDKFFNGQLSTVPEMREVLLRRRNANWSRWVQRRMAAPGSVMLAVGAGHLAGRDSLVDLLRRSGYKVRRVQ